MIEAIFEAVRGKRKQAVRQRNEQYWECVQALAESAEVDADFLVELMDALGKSEADLSKDVAKNTERRPYQTELVRLQGIQQTIPRLTQDVDKAQKALSDAVQKYQPAIDVAATALRAAQNEILQIPNLEDRLTETIDPSLIERRNTLTAQRMEIASKLRPLDADRVTCEQYCRAYTDSLERLNRQRRESSHIDFAARTEINQKLAQAKINESSSSKRLRTINAEISELQSQLSGVDAQLESLRLEMIAS